MSTFEQIQEDVRRLSKTDQEALLDWLTNLAEDDLEFTDEFQAKIRRAEANMAAGRCRIVRPNSIN